METAPYFSSVHDPRVVGRCKHKLSDILMVALITYLCGGEDYSDIYQLCRFRGKEFKPLLELPNGCPSEDTFERVMQAVHPNEIAACLEVYTSQIIKDLSGIHIAIDGKKMRGTNPRGHGESSYILSAWVNEHSTFREDACRARKNFSARNLNLIRKFALAILRQQHDTLSLKARRWKCSLRIDYLKQVLGF